MDKFEIGKTYATCSACDHNCIFSYTVVSRTRCTVTLKDKYGDVQKRRIIKRLTEYKGVETIFPEGNYSMAPVLDATDVVEETKHEYIPHLVLLK